MTPEERLRILHVFRTPLGGLFRHVLDLARGQAARGHDVGIFCDSSTGGERARSALAELEPHLTLGLIRIPMRRQVHPLDLYGIAALARACRRLQPNVLHGHGSKGGAFARSVVVPSRGAQVIRAYTPHGGSFNYYPGSPAHRLFMGAEKLLARRTDVLLFESDYIRDRFETYCGSPPTLVRIAHNGLAEAEFAPLDRKLDPFDLVYVGELRMAKGIETLIDAVALLRRQHGMRLTLMVVGSGPSGDELKARAKERGIWDSTAFVPPQPIRQALAAARTIVICSRAESLPYVVLEAVAAGQPIVSTNVGGIPEIFGPYGHELIPPDSPEALAAKIMQVHGRSPAEQARISGELSRYVRANFSLEGMISGVLAGYAFAAQGLAPARPASSPSALSVP
ncbi:MAG: glycosyltransferase family 4 protein [Methylobacteriaceae bacterium]|nr:glycosyltransferase family 4 protein [Methylobacteriaceae bacterium]